MKRLKCWGALFDTRSYGDWFGDGVIDSNKVFSTSISRILVGLGISSQFHNDITRTTALPKGFKVYKGYKCG